MPGVPITPPVDFAAGVVGTRGKLATSDNDTASKSPPVSMTPAVNLPQVSTTPMANNGTISDALSELEGKIYLP